MAAILSTITILDGNGSPIQVRVVDASGTGLGPYTFAKVIQDGQGVSGAAAVKPPSTPPLAGDSALVVTISPNSPPISVGHVQITDPTNTNVTQVKPASTAAVAADPSFVTTLSPNSIPTKIWDGTSTAAVKPSSTQPVATDPALVASLSPNSSPARLWDGTTTAVVKAASTPPAVGDPALVVALSPNSTSVGIGQVKIWDGTNVAAVKGASTAAGASDPSLVTQLSPNSGPTKLWDGTNTATVKGASIVPAAADPSLVVSLSPNTFWDQGSGTGGSHTQRVIFDSSQLAPLGQAVMASSAPVVIASDQSSVKVVYGTLGQAAMAASAPVVIASDQSTVKTGGNTVTQAASSTITRPANATPYASGQLVANSVTAGSVNNLQFTTLARVSGGSGVIVGASIQKSTTSVTNAAFRLHLFNTAPTYVTAGDGSNISTVVVASGKGYLGYVDITTMVAFSDVAWGTGAPDNTRGSIPYVATAQTIFALVEARGAYTPGSAEVFTIALDALQD